MSRGYYVPCAPFLYLVPDSGTTPPGMDCMPLQRSPGPFHYLIHEQAKSLVALQELQNEVGALLEFRDLVMETFPHLRNKMAGISHTSSSTPSSSGTSNIPIPLTSSSRREWEPGIRVRRKLKDPEIRDLRGRKQSSVQQTQQPKSGEGSGTSSAGSSAVQDSGFGTETSSSKEHSCTPGPLVVHRPAPITATATSTSTVLDEAEDELWNLLDVIHRKGTRLREEVEHLQQKFQAKHPPGVLVRRRSLGDIEEQFLDQERDTRLMEPSGTGSLRSLQRERDLLLDKVAEMEAETLASRARASQLQNELGCLIEVKRDLEEQLKAAVSQKSELNSRIHDLHMQFVGGRAPVLRRSTLSSPVRGSALQRRYSEGGATTVKPVKLGTLDGIISSPARIRRTARGVTPDPHKVAAILQEFSAIELQRHLLTTSVENKALQQRLERTVKSHVDLVEQFEKIKDENDDLKFQLEEKSIELEGTRARVRVLERLQQKPASSPENSTNPILPMPTEDNVQHSSSTESAHDHPAQSPRKRPSKIPLPGTKPPSGKSAVMNNRNRGSPSLRSRTDSNPSLSSKSLSGGRSRESPNGRNLSLSGRNNSRDSINSGSKSRDSISTSVGKNRGDSLSGKKSGVDSISSSKSRADTPSHLNSFSSNVSGSNRRESLSNGKGKDTSSYISTASSRKSIHSSIRGNRVGNNNLSINQRMSNDQGDQHMKELATSIEDNTEQPGGDNFPDSLNRVSSEDPPPNLFSHTTNIVTCSSSVASNVYQTSETQAFPWHSSSSEYFDSINNSGSAAFQKNSLIGSYYQSTPLREGLAECDSLEKAAVGIELNNIMADSGNDSEIFKVDETNSRNLWSKTEGPAKW